MWKGAVNGHSGPAMTTALMKSLQNGLHRVKPSSVNIPTGGSLYSLCYLKKKKRMERMWRRGMLKCVYRIVYRIQTDAYVREIVKE